MNIDKPFIINAPLLNHIPSLRSLWREAFGDTEEFLNYFFKTAFSPDRCRCVMTAEKVAAALYWFDCLHMGKQIAYLYAIATAKAYRGQGICHKLMTDTHLHLSKLGYEGAMLVPGNQELFNFYKSIGYRTCSSICEFTCSGSAEDVPLSLISKTEYAKLRRHLLPEGGVIQENENLDFLQTQATFYAGPDFLLAARAETNNLYGIELLGNATAAPEIVHALGYKKGTFRTPGGNVPFTMYYPFGGSKLQAPAYFGLAFD